MLRKIKIFLFGEVAKGERLFEKQPSFRTTTAQCFLTYGEWVKYVNFSRQYHT
jgi:hypothetical protein